MKVVCVSAALLAMVAHAQQDGEPYRVMYNRKNPSKHEVLMCENPARMVGFQPANENDKHNNWGSDESIECATFKDAGSQASKHWVTTRRFGDVIECDISKGFSGIAACGGGDNGDCYCNGGANQGCPKPDETQNTMLRCAKGLPIITSDVVDVVAHSSSDSADCPKGYVVYRVCSSGEERACRTERGQKVYSLVGCVRSAGSTSQEPGRVIQHVTGYWKDLGTYNKRMKYSVSEGVEDSRGQSLESEQSRAYGFSQEITVGVEVGFGSTKATSELGVGFSQNFESSAKSTMSTMFTKSTFQTWDLPCGGDDTGFQTIYQWWYKTKTADGGEGPLVKTASFLCVEGTPKSPNRPRCAPQYCEDEHRCDVCEYDFCTIHSVGTSKIGDTQFHFDAKCVDLKLGHSDWGKDEEAPEAFETEHVRMGVIMQRDQATLYRKYNTTEETVGDAWGTFYGSADIQPGDRFRVLTWELESAAVFAAPSTLAAVALTLLSALITLN